jgi:hypothetical protein
MRFGEVLRSKNRAPTSQLQVSTAKGLCFESGYWKWKQNTRYCGLRLTYATDSVTFSSAAVNRIVIQAA